MRRPALVRHALLALLVVGAALPVASAAGQAAVPAAPAASQTAAPVKPTIAPLPSGVVAVVRREDGSTVVEISQAQFDRWVASVKSQNPRRSAARAANQAMRQLLNLNWILAEMDRRKIVFTESRIARKRRAVIKGQLNGFDGYRKFLRDSGLTEEDVRLNLIADLGQTAIVRQVQASIERSTPPSDEPLTEEDLFEQIRVLEAQQRAIDAFRTGFLTRWTALTTCAPAQAHLGVCSKPPER